MSNELVNIAKELRKRSLHKEEAYLNKLIKTSVWFMAPLMGLLPAAAAAFEGYIAAALVAGTTAGIFQTLKLSEGTKSILKDLTSDLEMESGGDLYIKWRNKLRSTDLIDGWGSFPLNDPYGMSWIRGFIDKRMATRTLLSEAEFEQSIEEYAKKSGEEILSWRTWGLDNEEGWVNSFNAIASHWKAQDLLEEQGIDWRTGKPAADGEPVAAAEPKADKDTASNSDAEIRRALEDESGQKEDAIADTGKTDGSFWESIGIRNEDQLSSGEANLGDFYKAIGVS